MGATGLALLLVAAVLHAGVNALLKQARDKLAFTWWLLAVGSVLGAPLLWLGLPKDAVGWQLVLASGLLEAVYFVTLSRAYSLGELSLVYPLARGSAPLFIVAWAGLFLGERHSLVGLCGIATVVVGLYLINLPSLADWNRPLAGFREPAARWALLTGVLISAYATVDKAAVAENEAGVKHVHPVPYLVLILAVGCVILSVQWLIPSRRRALLDEVAPRRDGKANSAPAYILLGALCGNATYLLVLLTMRLAPVAYVGAVREVSVVFGAWIGVRYFGERGGGVRVVASALVVLGMVLITAGG